MQHCSPGSAPPCRQRGWVGGWRRWRAGGGGEGRWGVNPYQTPDPHPPTAKRPDTRFTTSLLVYEIIKHVPCLVSAMPKTHKLILLLNNRTRAEHCHINRDQKQPRTREKPLPPPPRAVQLKYKQSLSNVWAVRLFPYRPVWLRQADSSHTVSNACQSG